MTAHISIEVLHGRAFVGPDDEARAIAAAEQVFASRGADALVAQAEYLRQWQDLDDEARMSGLALDFIAARTAADVALTSGWASPDGAACTINVWRVK